MHTDKRAIGSERRLPPEMAMAAARRSEPQSTTPRPSISPLSVHSKSQKPSPITKRDAMIREVEARDDAEVENALDTTRLSAEVGEQQDEGSSSLSEPEEDENEDGEGMNGTDEEAALAEDLTAQRSLDVDSEAETERLDQTPKKLRKHADSLGRTPSKLSQAETAEGELSDPPSPVPAGVGAASSTSTVATAGEWSREIEIGVRRDCGAMRLT